MRNLYNFCWEFCHECFFADPKGNNVPTLVLNCPIEFSVKIEEKLRNSGFTCTAFIKHGSSSAIMRFRKIKTTAKG